MSHSPTPSLDKDNRIKIRPYDSCGLISVACGGIAILLPLLIWNDMHTNRSNTQDVNAVATIFIACLIPCIITGYLYFRGLIVASPNGLRIRDFKTSQFVLWAEIEDYELRYPKAPSRTDISPDAYIKIKGQWQKLIGVKPETQLLLDAIAQEATHSKSGSWQSSDVRPDGEWPKTFTYPKRVPSNPFQGLIFWLIHMGMIYVLGRGGSPGAVLIWLKSLWFGLSLLEQVLVVILVVLTYTALVFVPKWLEQGANEKYQTYANLKIEATTKGLTFTQGTHERFVAWPDITNYHLEKPQGYPRKTLYVLESRRDRFEFYANLANIETLKSIIENQATNASTSGWVFQNGDNGLIVGGANSLWPSGQVGVGPKSYHYRTWLSLVVLVVFAGVVFGGYLASIINPNYSKTSVEEFWEGLPFAIVALVPFLYCLANYFLASVRCDDNGLHTKGVLGTKDIPWKEITKLEYNGAYLLVTSSRGKIRLINYVADFAGLTQDIQRRSGKKVERNPSAM